MLNERPKKEKKPKNYGNPTKSQLFWRIQREGWRRSVTPSLMYLFMSLLAFACTTIDSFIVQVVLGTVCILGGAAFNAHLCYRFGKTHYDAYITGCIHRKNQSYGIPSGGDHHVEREYRVWKGFFIGLCIGAPVIVFGLIAAFVPEVKLALMMFTGYAIFPIVWIGMSMETTLNAGWCILMIFLPIIVSGIFYIIGAQKEKSIKEKETERIDTIADLAKAQQEQKQREQTEEQRRKTLLSKKKK